MMFIHYFVVPVTVLVFSLIAGWYYIFFSYKRYLKVYPSPMQIPLLGLTYLVRNTVELYYKILSLSKVLGKNVFGMVGPFPILFTSDPKVFAAVLGSPKFVNKPPLYMVLESIVANSLLLANGDEWKYQRKLLNPALDYINVKHYIHTFNARSDDLIKMLSKEIGKESTTVEGVIEYWSLLQTYETMLGDSAPPKDKLDFIEGLKCVMKIAIKRNVRLNELFKPTYVLTRNYWIERKMVRIIYDHIRNVIRTKKVEVEMEKIQRDRPILIDILLRQMRTDDNVNETFIAQQLNLMIAAGFDTTATAVCFALYNLSIYRDIQQKAYEEVFSVLGDDITQPITHDHIKDMKYLDLVIKESMRIKTTVPFFLRKLDEDLECNGNILPKGLIIFFGAYIMHLDSELYPDPKKFVPERFLPENVLSNKYSYVPFCGGIRNCIGQKYALLAIKVVLSKILLNYELVEVDQELCLACEITLRSKTGIKVAFRKRN